MGSANDERSKLRQSLRSLTSSVVVDGKQICKTKLVQVYPHQLCEAYASAASFVFYASRPAVVVAQAEALRRRSAREAAATESADVEADELMPSELAVTPLVQSQVCDALQEGSVDPFGLGFSDLDGSQFKDTFSLKTIANERRRPSGSHAVTESINRSSLAKLPFT